MRTIRAIWCVLFHRQHWSPLAVCRDCAKCGREFVDLKGMTILFHVDSRRPAPRPPRES